jgi:type I restriction enzyme R subunit
MSNEANAVEDFLLDGMTRQGWRYVCGADVERSTDDVMLETTVRAALVDLNSEIAADPSRADERCYKLRQTRRASARQLKTAAAELFELLETTGEAK